MSPETPKPSAGRPPAGPVSAPASKPKAEFTFRPTGSGGPKTELPPNPVVERFKEPEPPTPLERMVPVIKGVVVGLAVLILLLVALYFIPLPGVDATAATDRASGALRTVRALPTQHQPIVTLMDAVRPLRDTADSGLVAALLAVVALGEVRTGDRVTGLRQCEYVVNTYTSAPAAQLVAYDALTEQCGKCKGKGRVAESLRSPKGVRSMDDDAVMCLKCQGKGKLFSESAVDAQYAKALAAAEAALKAENRSGSLLSFLVRLQSRLHRAFGRAQSASPTTSAGATNAPPM